MFQDSSNFVACLATCGFAFLCNLGICLISPHVDSFLHVLSPFPRILVSRTFTIVNFTNSMLLWCSFWGFFDMVFISDFYLILSFTLTTLVFVGFACFNTLNGVPASVELDWMGQKEYCTVSTLMQVLFPPLLDLTWPLLDNQTQYFWESKLKSEDQLRSSISNSQLETNSTEKSSFLTFWKSSPLFVSPCPWYLCSNFAHIPV